MLIQYGCEFDLTFTQETPAVLLIDVHTSHARNVVAPTLSFESTPRLAHQAFIDDFGNIGRRFTAPAGPLRVKLGGIYRADGNLDRRDASAKVLPVDRLPAECLAFLTPSRFCESDCSERWRGSSSGIFRATRLWSKRSARMPTTG